ncbi:hypothetical protein M5J15_04190 [Serratia symbiotica]|nr:hypothetical protein M5J15_04190 [Serratia symbiotica]
MSPPGERKFLGYSISPGKGKAWILIAPESIRRAKSRRREITGRSKGRSLEQVIGKLRVYLTGWRNYYSLIQSERVTVTDAQPAGVDKKEVA